MQPTRVRHIRTFTMLATCLVALGWTIPAQGVLKDSNVAGDWNTGTNWTPAGVPVSGVDHVTVDLNMSVSANTNFGDTTTFNASSMSGSNPILTMNGSNTLQHIAGSTLNITSSQPYVAGTGTFKNSGTIENFSARFLFLSGGTTIDNSGTFNFRGTNSKLDFFDLTTPKFINNGNIAVNMTGATDIARIYNEQATYGGGQFVQQGTAIQFTQGYLVFAPPSLGGASFTTGLTDANFPQLFDPTSLNTGTKQLRLGGGYDITLDSTVTNLSNVYLGDNDANSNYYARPGGTTINVTGAGIRTAPVAAGLVNTRSASDTVTNKGTIVVANNGGQFYLDGNGRFINEGSLVLQNNRFLLGVAGDPTLENKGIIRFTENGSRIDLYDGAPIIKNQAGGQLVVDMPNATDVGRIASDTGPLTASYTGQYRHDGGLPAQFIKGTLLMAPPGGINAPLTDSLFASMFGAINANSTLVLSGGISDISLSTTNMSRVRFGDTTYQYRVPVGGSTLNVTAAGGLRTADGAPQATIATGRTLTNQGTLVMSSGHQLYINGDGTLLNTGTMIVENNRFLIGVSANPTFNNSGTIRFTENSSRIDLFGTTAANSFNNLANGLVQVQLALGTQTSDIGRESGSGGTFTNLGTIEVLRGELVIESGIANTTAVTGGNTLATGNWRVIADAARSRLNLQVGGTSTGSITTIASAASVVLSNQNSGTVEFPQLGAISNLQGSFYVHNFTHTVSSAMAVTGTLGGNGTIASPGSITFTGGTLNPASLTGGSGTLNVVGNLVLGNTTQLNFSLATGGIVGGVNDLVTVNGNLTLDGVLNVTELPGFGAGGAYRLFNYTGSLTNLGLVLSNPIFVIDTSVAGQVNLLLIPEPSSGLLLMGVCLFRRRKAAGKQAISVGEKN